LSDEIIFLRKQEVIDIHAQLIIAFGGSEGLRDEGALESALAAPDGRHPEPGQDSLLHDRRVEHSLTHRAHQPGLLAGLDRTIRQDR
jgi:hypothetical protein